MSTLRQALQRVGGLLAVGARACGPLQTAAGQQTQPAAALLGLRGWASQSWAAQAAAGPPAAAAEGERPQRQQQRPMPPWTPTRLLEKRKVLHKRMQYMLTTLERERVEEAVQQRPAPEFRAGDVLELRLSVPENRRRATVFKGTCIALRNRGYRTSFTLRNFIGNSGGIERTFPLYSPHILEIKVLERRHVRRGKLYYLRDRVPKDYRVN